MAFLSLPAAAGVGLASLSISGAEPPGALHLAQAQPFVTTQGVVGPRGDYMTTPEGCTYRHTQAPGQPLRWIIVQNPHHIGKPASPGSCKAML